MVSPIRHRHLKQLVDSAVGLGGPKLETALWRRLQPLGLGPSPVALAAPGAGGPGGLPAAERQEARRLRALVAGALQALAERLDQELPRALGLARQAWESADSHELVDPHLDATLRGTRHTLERAAARPDAVGAVALEGLLALQAAWGLAVVTERRLSSLIRLRLRSDEALLPGGRPFLDLGAAIGEAARAWA